MHKQIVALLAVGLSLAVGQTNFTISTQNLTDPSQNLPEFPCDYPSSGENWTSTVPAHPTFSWPSAPHASAFCLCPVHPTDLGPAQLLVAVPFCSCVSSSQCGLSHTCRHPAWCRDVAVAAVSAEGIGLEECSAAGPVVMGMAAGQHPAASCGASSFTSAHCCRLYTGRHVADAPQFPLFIWCQQALSGQGCVLSVERQH